MPLFTPLESPAAHQLTLTLLHFLWQGALIAAVTWILLRAVRWPSSRVRYLIATVGLLAQSLSPVITYFVLLDIHAASALTERTVTRSSRLDVVPARASKSGRPTPVTNHTAGNTAGSTGGSSLARLPLATWQPLLLALWITGVGLLLLRLVFSAGYGQWLRGRTQPVPPALSDRLNRISARLGVHCGWQVSVSRRTGEALVVGCWKPLVLLPAAWLTELPPDAVEAIVAHELAHIRRWDLWINVWQRLVETILFYHPAVWWISRQMRLEREMCCDELAVAATGEPVVYANALRLAAGRRVASLRPALSAAMRGESRMSLLRRVRNVLGVSPIEQRTVWWQVVLLAVLIPLGATTAPALFQELATPAVADEDDQDREVRRERQRGQDRRAQRERDERVEFDRRQDRDHDRDHSSGDSRDRDRPTGPRRSHDPDPRNERDGDRDSSDLDRRQGSRRDNDFTVPDERRRRRTRRALPLRAPVARDDRNPFNREDRLMRLIIELKEEVAGLREQVRGLREQQSATPRESNDFGLAKRRHEEANRQRESDMAEAMRHRANAKEAARKDKEDRAAEGRNRGKAKQREKQRQDQAKLHRDQDVAEVERHQLDANSTRNEFIRDRARQLRRAQDNQAAAGRRSQPKRRKSQRSEEAQRGEERPERGSADPEDKGGESDDVPKNGDAQ